MEAPIKILRDCDVTLIPSGDEIKLIKGTLVRITQALGGDFTLYVNGNLVKLSGKDADAIGEEIDDGIKKSVEINNGKYSEELVWEQLRTCFDPEIPVNIVDLGLIYDMKLDKDIEGITINIKMTLTAPGCGMGPVIAQDVEDKLMTLASVNRVIVELVWEPVWNQAMMTDAARLELGML